MGYSDTFIEKCETLIRKIENGFALKFAEESDKNFKIEINNALKFRDKEGWNKLVAIIDLLGDTELAKKSYLELVARKLPKVKDQGEIYLRVYGVLNAIFLQKEAVRQFITLVSPSERQKYFEKIKSLEILQLRSIAGAHTINYSDTQNKIPYQITRYGLEHGIVSALAPDFTCKKFNIQECIFEYNSVVNEILFQTTESFISKVFKKNQELKDYYTAELYNFEKLI